MEYLKRIENEFTLTFKDIFYQVKIKDKQTNTEFYKTIINNVSGQAKSGELTAIMGPSGSGKTSLLNFITSRINFTPHTINSGELYVNEKALDFDSIGHYSGYVMQDDCLFATLTPKENITFAVRLKNLTTEEDLEDCVEKFLKDLQIQGCKDTPIGNADLKGISGGERKRVAIGMELVSNPSILFLDEPTSGLDSQTSYKIVSLLKKIAVEKNMIVVCTIHQPSSNIFNIFNKLIIIERGNLIFNDSPTNISNYFISIQRPLNPKANPADSFMKILEENSKNKKQADLDYFIDSYKNKDREIKKNIENFLSETELGINIHSKSEDTANTMDQIKILSGRAMKNVIRNPIIVKMRLCTTLLFSFLCASVFWQLDDDTYDGVHGRIGFIFFILTNVFMEQVFGNLLSFPIERAVFIREYYSRMYRAFPYYVAKNIVESPVYILFTAIFATIIYFTAGLRTSAEHFFIYLGMMLLLCICSQSMAYFVGSFFSRVEEALSIANVIVLPFLIFSGTLINEDSVPKWLAWIKYISPVKYSNTIGVTNEFKNNEALTYDGGWKKSLDSMNFDVSVELSFALIAIMAVIYRVAGYYALKNMISKTG